jgi:hypothetical protein
MRDTTVDVDRSVVVGEDGQLIRSQRKRGSCNA